MKIESYEDDLIVQIFGTLKEYVDKNENLTLLDAIQIVN